MLLVGVLDTLKSVLPPPVCSPWIPPPIPPSLWSPPCSLNAPALISLLLALIRNQPKSPEKLPQSALVRCLPTRSLPTNRRRCFPTLYCIWEATKCPILAGSRIRRSCSGRWAADSYINYWYTVLYLEPLCLLYLFNTVLCCIMYYYRYFIVLYNAMIYFWMYYLFPYKSPSLSISLTLHP